MIRQDMIDTMRRMGWEPFGNAYPCMRVGVVKWGRGKTRSIALWRYRQHSYQQNDDRPPGEVVGCMSWLIDVDDSGPHGWSNLCDDEVLRFYLKIMMEGL